MELGLTNITKTYTLSSEEARIIELFRSALKKEYADIGIVIHNGKLVSASVNEKFKF